MLPSRVVSTAHRIRTKLCRAGVPNAITHAKCEINWYQIVTFGEGLTFLVLALLRRTPLTRQSPAGLPVIDELYTEYYLVSNEDIYNCWCLHVIYSCIRIVMRTSLLVSRMCVGHRHMDMVTRLTMILIKSSWRSPSTCPTLILLPERKYIQAMQAEMRIFKSISFHSRDNHYKGFLTN